MLIALRSWLRWIFHGRSELNRLRRELAEQIETIKVLQVDVARLKATQSPQIVPQLPQARPEVVRARNFREFKSMVETFDGE